ncbi:MAG: thiamine phosphate synthase [Devosiaceae bacterium]|nr:thiamine phosphate synthase [Devosiaceae bacterium]
MQIILSTPQNLTMANLPAFSPALILALETGLVSAILVDCPDVEAKEYQQLSTAIIKISQPRHCATLLHNSPHLVSSLGADGVHISSSHEDFIAATKLLKPNFIVGAGNITSRHQAMLAGEAGADYICFGSIKGAGSNEIDLAHWWTKLFQIPCAIFDQQSNPLEINNPPAEYLGLGQNLWNLDKKPNETLLMMKDRIGIHERQNN